MKKAIYIIIILLLAQCTSVFAQTCIEGRYTSAVFSNVTVSNDIYYGSSPVWTIPYDDEDHYFDFYEPTGDAVTKRPLIIFMHGGAFLGGWKAQPEIVSYANAMAQKGFCVASISYRLGFNVLSTASAERAVYRAIQDGKAAIRFFKEYHQTYNIDTTLIFMGGNSAGSISSIHAAYVEDSERPPSSYGSGTPDLLCLDCTGNSYVHNSNPVALVNLWGALMDLNMMDAYEQVPFISFHGDNDNIVSPDIDNPFNYPLFPALHGANSIEAHANTLGILNEKHIFPGEGHEPWTNTTHMDFILEESSSFLLDLFQPAPPVITGGSLFCENETSIFLANYNPDWTYCWSAMNATLINATANLATFQFTTLGVDSIYLVVENENGATSTEESWLVNVSPAPSLSINNLPAVVSSLSPINLTASPSGGTFSGNGMVSNTFNPAISGSGIHTVTYSYQNGACLESISQDIFVFNIAYNFANYQLGTISP